MGRRTIVCIVLVGTATLLMAHGALAQSSGVQFVLDGPVTLKDGRAEVQLLNGNPTPQEITVTAEGEDAKRLAVERGGRVPGLGRLTVVVTRVGDPPADAFTVAILAISTDGSVARSSVKVPAVPAAGPLPSSITTRGRTTWLPSPLTALLGWEQTHFPARQLEGSTIDAAGFVTSDTGGLVAATIVDGKLTIEPSDRSGEYTGKLTSGDKTIDVKAKAKDVVWWPLACLLSGLGVAYLLERYLARRRPANHLKLILNNLKDQTERFQSDAAGRTERLATGLEQFKIDRMYEAPEGGYLGTTARDIERRYGQALAEFEREANGPNGTAVKDLDAKVQDFFQHLRNIVDLVAYYRTEGPTSQRNVDEQVHGVLNGELIDTAAKLTERKTRVTDTMSRLRDAHALVDRCKRLAEYALQEDRRDEADRAQELAEDIWAGIDLSDPKWRDPFVEEWETIRKSIEAPRKRSKARAAQGELPEEQFGARHWGYPVAGPIRTTAPGDDMPLPDVTAEVRRKINRADGRFAVMSGVIVVITGLTALYFSDDTFGTGGDYAAMLTWGATVQQGVNLLRRVWASRITQLSV